MDNSIFYFTGTGNSLKISKDLGDKIHNTNIISIAKNISKVKALEAKGIVGFVFPVYYCGIPEIVETFLNNIDLSKASYIFIISVYGATGGNSSINQVKNIFKKINCKLNSAFYIKGVDNFNIWALKGDIPSIKKQEKIHESVNKRIKIISKIILDKKEHFDKSFVEYIGPIIFQHKNFIKTVKNRDMSFNVGSKCNSCGLCARICPVKNIKIEITPQWLHRCQFCLGCLHMCPNKAINYKKVTLKRQRYRNPYVKIEEFFNE